MAGLTLLEMPVGRAGRPPVSVLQVPGMNTLLARCRLGPRSILFQAFADPTPAAALSEPGNQQNACRCKTCRSPWHRTI